jgi:hypothetical protein
MKKTFLYTSILSSLLIISCRQNDDILSSEDIKTLNVIKSRNSKFYSTSSEEVVKNVNGITKETSLRSKIDTLMISSLNGEVILPPKK